ncbi:MAG TPA: glycosyltransferase [Longimicrobiales bacterium]
MTRKILYVQYTNPAAYPPLLHSAAILAEQRWEVVFVGIVGDGSAQLVMPGHSRIRVEHVGRQSGGPFGKLKYAGFALRSLLAALRFRPDWCYASDPLSAPAALAIKGIGTKIVYHEHDAPGPGLDRVVLRARERLAAVADVLIAPAASRATLLPPSRAEKFVVWNCPRRDEAAVARPADTGTRFDLVYHGSLSRDRLTPQFVDAMQMLPPTVHLHIYGYETVGHRGYAQEVVDRAAGAGISDRVHLHGAVPERAALLDRLRGHHLGISTISSVAADRNLHTLAGASNKAFEYLAAGIPLLISADPAWRTLYEEPGYAAVCNPEDAESIATAVRPLCEDPGRARQMGESGRQRVLTDWNYETQFEPVLRKLSA